jgi:hypothetical protein
MLARVTLVSALLLAACFITPKHEPDQQPDAAVDSPNGSAALAARTQLEASPKDHQLEIAVLGMSLVVALGPLRPRKRRA